MSFWHAVTCVIEREGGYVNDPHDPGGETKYGISKRAFPSADIKNLTIAQAQDIYRRYYWEPMRGDQFSGSLEPIAHVLFDCAVNQGVVKATKLAQAVCGVTEDGNLGPVTLAALKAHSPSQFVEKFQAERILHYASLPTWSRYGRGWSRRAISTAMEAMK